MHCFSIIRYSSHLCFNTNTGINFLRLPIYYLISLSPNLHCNLSLNITLSLSLSFFSLPVLCVLVHHLSSSPSLSLISVSLFLIYSSSSSFWSSSSFSSSLLSPLGYDSFSFLSTIFLISHTYFLLFMATYLIPSYTLAISHYLPSLCIIYPLYLSFIPLSLTSLVPSIHRVRLCVVSLTPPTSPHLPRPSLHYYFLLVSPHYTFPHYLSFHFPFAGIYFYLFYRSIAVSPPWPVAFSLAQHLFIFPCLASS